MGAPMHVFPSSRPRPTKSHAELAVYDALKACSAEGLVFHSLRLRDGQGFEGEGDFVLAHPTRGLLVLEVKGGRIELSDGLWKQNGKVLEVAPRDQGQRFVRKLVDVLRSEGLEVPSFGVACAFPDCEFSRGPTNGDLAGLIIGARELPHLSSVLDAVFTAAIPAPRVVRSRKWMDRLKTLWGETWVPTVSLSDRVEDEAKRVALDAAQYRLLEFAGETPRAQVTGEAGSGKTLIAMELCRRRHARGLRTLYLCFTDALARAVDRQFGAQAGLKAISIRQFAVELLRKSGVAIPAPDKKFWDEVSFQAACDALPLEGERPDMVVVDEGQDFELNDWELVQQLAGSRGLWVFRDSRQAFWSERQVPDALERSLGAVLSLPKGQRCPPGLAAFADQYVSETRDPPDVGGVLNIIESSEERVVERVRHELEALLREGARPEQIAVVSLSGQTRSKLFACQSFGTIPACHADANEAASSVVVETFLRFKGLERPFVIVAELGGAHVTHYETRMYIALTRATVKAIVIADSARIAADERLRRVRENKV